MALAPKPQDLKPVIVITLDQNNNERAHRVRKAYLSKFVDPEKLYPVEYNVLPSGEKNWKESELLGKDLTENQVLYLFAKELL